MRGKATAAALVAVALALAGCPKKATVPPADPPRRPKERVVQQEQPGRVDTSRTDCDRWIITQLPPALQYVDRSVEEGQNLANQAFAVLRESEDRARPVPERQLKLTKAVEIFITALHADPYNVHALYNLAAAYARIDRKWCVINLLARLKQLREHPSQRDKVNQKIDRLLGRGQYKNNLDPDFYEMRDDPDFRELVKDF